MDDLEIADKTQICESWEAAMGSANLMPEFFQTTHLGLTLG
jgi:hypothetical protein